MKKFIIISATVTVKRTVRDKEGNQVGEPTTADVELSAEEQSSGFEPMA